MTDPIVLRDWQSFYLLTGTGAATLIGLIFVAFSLGARLVTPQRIRSINAFVTPSVIHFAAVLILSMLSLVPTLTWQSLGVALTLVGLAGILHCASVAREMGLHQQEQQNALDTHHWLWHLLLPGACYILVFSTGLGLLAGLDWFVDLLALAVTGLIIVALRNTFDLTMWIAQQTA